MTVRRDRLFITTDIGAAADARQDALQSQTAAVSDLDADLFGIEQFMHSYDPDAARAWMEDARNPMIGGVRALDKPFDPTAKRPGSSTLPLGRTQANKLRILGIIGVTNGMSAQRARELLVGATQAPWSPIDSSDAETMLNLVPATGNVSLAQLAPETPAEWERIAAAIDAVAYSASWDAQYAVVNGTMESLRKFFRSINLCYFTPLPLRRLCERLWGFYAFASDEYLLGMSSQTVENLLAPYSPAPYVPGVWRVRGAAYQQNMFGARTQGGLGKWGPGDVQFGLPSDFNGDSIGCYQEDQHANIINPNTCDRPTGETHRIWFQSDARLFGGINYSPEFLLSLTDQEEYSTSSSMEVFGSAGDYNTLMLPYTNPEWRTPFYCAKHRTIGRDRLWMVPPLEWYWRMYFSPQPEFGGRSFADWFMSQPPSRFVRDVRRWNTQRNLRMATQYNTLIENLAGSAEVQAAERAHQQEQTALGQEQMVQSVGTGVAAAAMHAGPIGAVVGLVIGAATAVTVLLMSRLHSSMPEVKIDVWGVMEPAFSQFAITSDKSRFAASWDQQIGMPQQSNDASNVGIVAAPSRTRSSVTRVLKPSSLQARAAAGTIVVTNLPSAFGDVTLDGSAVRYQLGGAGEKEATLSAAPGTHEVTVTDASGARAVRSVIVATGQTVRVNVDALVPIAKRSRAPTVRHAPQPIATRATSEPDTTASGASANSPDSKTPATGDGTDAAGVSGGATLAIAAGVLAIAGGAAWFFFGRRRKPNRAFTRRRRVRR